MRHRVERQIDLSQALNQAAADVGMPTSALITVWLLDLLELRRPHLHVRDAYRSGIEQFERRPRRPSEWPDDRCFDALMRQARDDRDGGSDATPDQEGGTLIATDERATQSSTLH